MLDAENLRFHAVVLGPAGTVYEGGEWHFEYTVREEYPFKPPFTNIKAFNRLYHPEIKNIENGIPHFFGCSGCAGDSWSPALTMAK